MAVSGQRVSVNVSQCLQMSVNGQRVSVSVSQCQKVSVNVSKWSKSVSKNQCSSGWSVSVSFFNLNTSNTNSGN